MRLAAYFFAIGLSLPLLACAPRATLEGPAVQGGLMIGHAGRDASVSLDGQIVRTMPSGTFVIGFGRDHPPQAVLTTTLGERAHSKKIRVAQRQYDVQKIDDLPDAMVTPPPEITARIAEDGRKVANARRVVNYGDWFLDRFRAPAKGPISGVYGSQRILNGQPRQPHYGLDIAAGEGAPVTETVGGRVTLAEELYFTGNTVIVDHGYGVSSTYSHLKTMSVRFGQMVRQGDAIGTVGATGRATGPHLDWRVNWFSERLDPALLLTRRPNAFLRYVKR